MIFIFGIDVGDFRGGVMGIPLEGADRFINSFALRRKVEGPGTLEQFDCIKNSVENSSTLVGIKIVPLLDSETEYYGRKVCQKL